MRDQKQKVEAVQFIFADVNCDNRALEIWETIHEAAPSARMADIVSEPLWEPMETVIFTAEGAADQLEAIVDMINRCIPPSTTRSQRHV